MKKKTTYKIIFMQLGEIYEIFAKQIYQSDMYGFIEVEEYIFNQNKQLVVDPTSEKLEKEFKSVERSYIPINSVIRIDEVIESGDPLLLEFPSSEGEIKVKQWIPNADPAMPASFDWRPGCHWLPYQLPSFVTPPFAGYVSGHSTFSAAAAELLATMTGSPFFPGGMGSFSFDPSYLNFDVGPSESFNLQWATYKDAADQSGLSRIWGGIHPPVDDIRGRIIGDNIADQCLELGANLFEPNQSGCTYVDAMNYDSSVTQDDGSCLFAFEDPCPGDLNGDSEVDVHDLLDLFTYFGNICD